MTFDADEIERYARHFVLGEVGGPGQQRLKSAHVVVIGAGGLGAPVIAYLAAAGVGRLTVVDDDTIALSNLQRQVIHRSSDVGRPKVDSAAAMVGALNPHVAVRPRAERLTGANAARLVAGAGVVVDGSDNAATRYVLSDACHHARVPLVSGAVSGWDGQLTTLTPYEARPDGTPWPTYRCLFPDPPPDAMEDACVRLGILGAVTGVIGTLQAGEALKLILGVGEPLRGRLLIYDAKAARFETIAYGWDPANPLTGRAQ